MASSTPLPHDLYLGSSTEDLDQLAVDVALSEEVAISWQLAEDSYIEATEKDNDRNEEAAYMLYKRHIYVVQQTQTTKEYLLNKDHWDQYFSKEKLLTAVERCEILASSLKQRYGIGNLRGKFKKSFQEWSHGKGNYEQKEDESSLSDNDSEFDDIEDETPEAENMANGKAVIVKNLPPAASEDTVELYFERRRLSDGGPVEKVDLRPDGSAIVYFEDAEVAARVLKKTNHQIKKTNVQVSMYMPEEPTITSEKTVEVRNFKHLSDDVLEMYFENSRKSGGGDIECLKRNEDTGAVYITFVSSKCAQKVLKIETHKIKDTILQVSAYMDGQESSEDNFDATCTIEVSDFGALSDEMLQLYFEDTRKSGGSDVTSLQRLDDIIYVTFEHGKAATRVVNREHKIKGQQISVNRIHSSDDQSADVKESTEPCTVQVQGCKDLTDDLLEMYFQNKKRSGGGDIKSMQRQDDDVFITFESAKVAQSVLDQSHKLGNCALRVSMDSTPDKAIFEQYGELEIDSSSSADDDSEEETFVLQVPDLKDMSEDTLMLYFENRRRSGGGEVEMVEVDANQKSALIYFLDRTAVTRILQKSPHLLEGKTLHVKPYTRSKPQGVRSWLRGMNKANIIEVKGCLDVGNEKLEFYFENQKRSGGSDVKQVRRSEENRDLAYIVFKEIEVATRVSSREHSIGKHQLQVTQIKPMPKYDNRFLITEMKESTTMERLSEHLRKYTQCSPINFEHGGDTGSVLVTVDTSKSPLRIKDIQKACSQRPLEGAFIDVSPIPISNCILVKGLSSDTDSDHLSLYFESPKSGNNTHVRVVKVEPYRLGEALVYFENYKGIEQILQKRHLLGSTNIAVSIYIECLQSAHKTVQLPSALCLDKLDKYLVKYICESPETEADLKMQLQNIHAELTWTSDQSASIECVLTEETPEVVALIKSWEKNVEETFQSFTDQFLVKVEKILDDTWHKVAPKLETLGRDQCKLYMLPGCMIAVIGPHSDVRCFLAEIQDVIHSAESVRQDADEEITEHVRTIDPLILRLLRNSQLTNIITAESAKVKVFFSKEDDQIIFNGPIKDVRRAKVQTEEMARTVVILEVENMSEAQIDLATKEDVQEYLLSKMSEKDLIGSWLTDKGKLKVAAFSDTDGHAVVHTMKQLVCEQNIKLKEESVTLVGSREWSDFVAIQCRNKGNFVKITADVQRQMVIISGTDDKIVYVSEDVNNFINENTVYSDHVQYRPGVQRFLAEHEIDYIRSLSEMYKRHSVVITESIAKVRFNIRGTKNGLNMVRSELDKLSKKVIHKKYEFNKPGVAKLLSSDKGEKVIRNAESAERCIIESDFNSLEKTKYGNTLSLHDIPESPETKLERTIASGCKLIVCEGDITELEVDAIVNAANQKLAHIGGLAKVIVDKGGSSIQEESDRFIKGATDLLVGDAVVTNAGRLSCKWIIHAVGPIWSGGKQGEKELLREAVFRSLEEADKKRMTSVAFPALSTGIFHFPKDDATRVIIEAIKDFFDGSPDSMIKEIYLCDKAPDTIEAFIQAIESQRGKDAVLQSQTSRGAHKPAGGILMPLAKEIAEGLTTFTVGKVRLTLKKGDITKEKVDCIVNCTNTDLSMQKGAVSKAIHRDGGRELAIEMTTKVGEMGRKGVVVTAAGDLPSEFIVHVAVDYFDSNWRKIIKNCFKAVQSQRNIKCIAFPAIETGSYENPPETMARIFVEALDEYKEKHNLQEVIVVIFQEELHEAFVKGVRQAVSKLKEPQTFFQRVTGMVWEGWKKKSDPAVTLHFFSDNSNHIEQAIARLEQHYMDNRLDKIITDTALRNMNTKQVKEIEKLKETFSVQVDYTARLGRVRLQGLMNSVLPAIDAVHKIIHEVDRYIQAAEKAQLLSAYLQWTYIEKDSTINEYDPFSNQAIEDAYRNGSKSVQITPAGRDPIEINFEQMVEYPVTKPTEQLPVVRKNLIKGASFDPPSTWVQMNSDSEMVQVDRDSEEYKVIEQRFFKDIGVKRNIIKIQRIQTKFLWQQYMAKKEQLEIQNPGHENEKFLWHGTTADAFQSIAKAGFNRSYCGRNATAYGEGVYFATSADYAVQNAYSKPDKDGHKHIFFVRALTGKFTKGKQGIRFPPTRDESKHVLYDSVVDDPSKPSMYVVFNDTQAYPVHLISFA